jgi:hypothetical protein
VGRYAGEDGECYFTCDVVSITTDRVLLKDTHVMLSDPIRSFPKDPCMRVSIVTL